MFIFALNANDCVYILCEMHNSNTYYANNGLNYCLVVRIPSTELQHPPAHCLDSKI